VPVDFLSISRTLTKLRTLTTVDLTGLHKAVTVKLSHCRPGQALIVLYVVSDGGSDVSRNMLRLYLQNCVVSDGVLFSFVFIKWRGVR
jgi:hypothetical protein